MLSRECYLAALGAGGLSASLGAHRSEPSDGPFAIVALGGEAIALSATAASLSPLLKSKGVATLPFAAPAVRTLVSCLELFCSRFVGEAPHDAIPALLKRRPFAEQAAVLSAARTLRVEVVARLAAIEVATLLRDRSPSTLRVVLDAPDDLTADEKREALSEPLLTPPDAGCHLNAAAATTRRDDSTPQALLNDCAVELDARSLRSLKAVSRTWWHRARTVLGHPGSAWRRAPEWSAGAWARATIAPRLQEPSTEAGGDMAACKRALVELEALDPAVELPEFAPALLRLLADPAGTASCRKLVLRSLARMEGPTLHLFHGAQIRQAVAGLEEFEVDAEATQRLMHKIREHVSNGWPHEAPTQGSKRKRPRPCDEDGERSHRRRGESGADLVVV